MKTMLFSMLTMIIAQSAVAADSAYNGHWHGTGVFNSSINNAIQGSADIDLVVSATGTTSTSTAEDKFILADGTVLKDLKGSFTFTDSTTVQSLANITWSDNGADSTSGQQLTTGPNRYSEKVVYGELTLVEVGQLTDANTLSRHGVILNSNGSIITYDVDMKKQAN